MLPKKLLTKKVVECPDCKEEVAWGLESSPQKRV